MPSNRRCQDVVIRGLALLALAAAVTGCGGEDTPSASPEGDCPVAPVSVVVSVGQWGGIVDELAGDCARVTTIVDGSAGDPHEFEPSPSDLAAFEGADLVVVNGLGYDTWASDAVDALSERPEVVSAGEVAGLSTGDNPHVWYDPAVVRDTASAVTAALGEVSADDATQHFAERAASWERSLEPYDAAIERITTAASGRTFAATESVFDPMAAALGLRDVTPSGYRRAAANESEPAAADLAAFEDALQDGSVDVLVFNTQTEGSVPEQLRQVAESAGVPVVEVTETAPEHTGFVAWQVTQLDALSRALGS